MSSNVVGKTQWARMYPRLTELCRDRTLSASDIARILNAELQLALPLTRNAVIGKICRANLRPPQPKTPSFKVEKADRAPPPPLPPPQTGGVLIVDLTGSTCRWPIAGTGADMRYCGVAEASMPALPYCKAHARMAYHGKGQSA